MILFLIFVGVILLLVYFWYVTIPVIILLVLWYFKDDIKKRRINQQAKANEKQYRTNQRIYGDSKYWNLTQEFNISESEARELFGYNFREYSTTKELYNRCLTAHKDQIELSSKPKYLILTLSLIFEKISKSYQNEIFNSKQYYVNITKEKLEEQSQNIQNSFKNVFENYEDLRLQYEEQKAKEVKERQEKARQEKEKKQKEKQEKSDKEKERQEKQKEKEKEKQEKARQNKENKDKEKSKEKSRKNYQKSKKKSENKSKSSNSRRNDSNYSRDSIFEKRIQDRLEKFSISENDAEIIFGKNWKKTLAKPEHLFFFDVWTLEIKVIYDPYGGYKARLGHLYSKLLEIVRIVDEENPELARGKKSQKSKNYSSEYNYNSRQSYGNYDYNEFFDEDEDDDDEDEEDDEFDDDYEFEDDAFTDDYEDGEKLKWAFSIFGLTRSATISEIKSRYRELSLKYHPDRNQSPDATLKMTEINNAYELLSKFVGAA